MRIATAPDFLEAVANHPDVLPRVSVRGQDRIDMGGIWPRCVGIEFDGGGYVFGITGTGVYEAHVMFLPGSKGVFEASLQAFEHMFGPVGATAITARIPDDVPAARRLAERVGFEFQGEGPTFHRPTGDLPSWLYLLTKERFQNVRR